MNVSPRLLGWRRVYSIGPRIDVFAIHLLLGWPIRNRSFDRTEGSDGGRRNENLRQVDFEGVSYGIVMYSGGSRVALSTHQWLRFKATALLFGQNRRAILDYAHLRWIRVAFATL